MTGTAQLRLWICEFFIRMAIIVMAPREGAIYARWLRRANREAWEPAWDGERRQDEWR